MKNHSPERTYPRGIVTLANDAMAEQLIALLNSITIQRITLPVFVIPYDENIVQIKKIIAARENVWLWDDADALERWETFAKQAWAEHPRALQTWEQKYGHAQVYRLAMHRRLAAFDVPCERFLFLDADMLVLDEVERLLDALDTHDIVVYDDQFRAPQHVFCLEAPRTVRRLNEDIFCAGLYASKRGMFTPERLDAILTGLREGDAEVLYLNGPDQSLLNYMVQCAQLRVRNLYRRESIRTCATVPGLREQNGRVYDHGKPLPFLHYIGIPAWAFQRLCAGQDVRFPYRDTFLRYRYIDAPHARPRLRGKPIDVLHRPTRVRRWLTRAAHTLERLR